MANIRLTERSDGTFYLQCRCGEVGQPCQYQGEFAFATAAGVSPLRQARLAAFEHCWSAHRIPAYHVDVEISKTAAETPAGSAMQPMSEIVEGFKSKNLKPQLVRKKSA